VDQILNKTRSSIPTSQKEAGFEVQDISGVERLASVIARTAQASAVFGEPVYQGATVIVPVAKAMWGVGGGKGPERTGDGSGGGMRVVPVGYIHIENGRARFHSIRKSALVFGTIALAVGALLMGGRQLRLMRRDRQAEAKDSSVSDGDE
jgi:uncharacterized spore protein YtfJ